MRGRLHASAAAGHRGVGEDRGGASRAVGRGHSAAIQRTEGRSQVEVELDADGPRTRELQAGVGLAGWIESGGQVPARSFKVRVLNLSNSGLTDIS